MELHLTLQYWMDDGWYVGKLKEVPGVFSQGKSLRELEENIRDAYHLMRAEEPSRNRAGLKSKEILVEVD